ncbi:MAG: hypothetical protein J3K34DRAFT_444301 [Monoraphidium minutum]|nr:MAG: hypothetical protein J3K34DRAFT_444301 [Monoraphidium minutum]
MASIFYLLLAPTLYILLATLGLLQFSVAFNALSGLALHLDRTPALDALAPVLKAYLRFLEGIFGPAYKFSPSATQVTLVALMLVIIVEMGRR